VVTTRLFLTGITVQGRHGANPGEKDQPQDFVVDLDVEVEVADDLLSSTADYRSLIRTARETVEQGSFDLLETLAHAVADVIVQQEGVLRVSAVVHKPGAARSIDVQGVAAAASAER
jgi:dihydroneopterin aldolase